MKSHPLVLVLAALLVTCVTVTYAFASQTVDGTIESSGSGKISVKDKDGKVHSFDVDDSAKITLDGKTAKLDDLGSGNSASVTAESKNNKTVAVMIIAKSKL